MYVGYTQLFKCVDIESSIAGGWKASPNFVESAAWEYRFHSPTEPPPAPTNQLLICNETVSSSEIGNYWKGILHIRWLLTDEYPSLQHHHSDICS